MNQPILQSMDVADRVEMRAKQRLKDYVQKYNATASEVENEVCRDCLLYYVKQHKGALWPNCDVGADINLKLEEHAGLLDNLDEGEKVVYSMMKDPVLWAKMFLGWEARAYQKDLLSCTAKHKAVRAGRRVGKCLVAGTLLPTRYGDLVPVEELVGKTFTTQGINPKTRKTIKRQQTTVTENVVQPVRKITTRSGREITASLEHPFLTWKGWQQLKNIQVGTDIAVPEKLRLEPTGDLEDHKLKLLAYVIGDGGVSRDYVRISNLLDCVQAEVLEIAEAFGCSISWPDPGITSQIVNRAGSKNPVMEYLREIGIMGKTAHEKTIPACIFRLRNDRVAEFLKRLFACDGWASVSHDGQRQIGYCTVNEALARQIQHLLLRFGVCSNLRWRKTPYDHGAWSLEIRERKYISKFAKEIGIFGKEDAVANVVLAAGGHTEEPEEAIYWDSVKSIEDMGDQKTYSVHVAVDDWDLKSFVANDIWQHNSDALCIDILYHCWTKPGKSEKENYQVLIVCPYERQVNALFKRMRELLGQSEELLNSVDQDTKNPQLITFTNGSSIMGIAAGVRTGSQASQARGQGADYLALDEADYLDQASIDALLPILVTNKNAKLWASSTPTGARSFFYKICMHKSEGYKEFYIPSSASPEWTDELELKFRKQYSEYSYRKEFEAEFGDEEEGVFQAKYIDPSLYSYEYKDCQRDPRNRYIMGVDWNSTGIGTHIVVTEYDTREHKFKVVDRDVVSAGDFTQHAAVARVIKMDERWSCDHIYVDEGYGRMNVEMLQKYGIDNPSSKMHKKLKAIPFGGKTEIRNPVTNELLKKHTKPLIVDLSARRLECYQCMFPKSEDFNQGLIGQMRMYKVEKYGRDGQPVYSQGDDHVLIAWMLTIFGFIMEFTDIAKGNKAHGIRFVNSQRGSIPITKQVKEDLSPKTRWAAANKQNKEDNTLQETIKPKNQKPVTKPAMGSIGAYFGLSKYKNTGRRSTF